MCGRTCLTLEPHEICKASTYSISGDNCSQNKWKQPQWRNEYNSGREYKPSYNLAPTDVSPVLVSAAHFDDDDLDTSTFQMEDTNKETNEPYSSDESDRILVPMVWGMIPYWHNSSIDFRKHGLSTNNCRSETMLESKLFRNAFHKGQRCVILCEGFYEWQTTDPKASKSSERTAYYIYMPQREGIRIEDKDSWHSSIDKLDLLQMAGLFDIWTNANGEQIYSYSIISFGSDDKLNWLHHRSPAILDNEKAVADWIDYKRVTDTSYLLGLLKPTSSLEWHPVSRLVNNARIKSDQCNKRIDESRRESTSESKLMQSWLSKQ